MTGRELAAALRPLEEWAGAIGRFSQIAKEAIHLETKLTGIALAQKELADTQAKVAAVKAHLADVQAEVAVASERLAEERAASLEATRREQAELVEAASAQVAQELARYAEWKTKTTHAETAHEARMAALRTEEAALQHHIEGLRDLARRYQQAAGAVPV